MVKNGARIAVRTITKNITRRTRETHTAHTTDDGAVYCAACSWCVLGVLQGSLGDSQLYAKMEQASQLIKRDIVFAASLYVN